VGPPGTGKTDVAVQIISNIYHNFPEQRTLIVTHSNQVYHQLHIVHEKLVTAVLSNIPVMCVVPQINFYRTRQF
jgi:tRNA A37 N6-isopentenylltransferase MiaA